MKTDRMVRVNTRSTASAMRDIITTGVLGHIETTIHIGTNVWKHPSTASSCLKDFGLVEKDSGAANPTPATSAPTMATLSTNSLPFNPSTLTPEARRRFQNKQDTKKSYMTGIEASTPFPSSVPNGTNHFYKLVNNNGLVLSDSTLYFNMGSVDSKTLACANVALADKTPSGILQWYCMFASMMNGQGIFILPFYGCRPGRGAKGFTIGLLE
ncbi:unnamed protein product [Cylindrotheca closterium]|uniref:Uncharacterized protein n=1 Tax=Cylindrotheca closterium TaxID=2856 RepID=A0AAD2GDW2_9STRA|nr:unnamed protein product [Cylindrotheca closterium]